MKTSVNIKMDEAVRDQCKEIFAQMGLDMTTAVNLFLLATLREKKIPFEISVGSNVNDEERFEKFFSQKLRLAEQQEQRGQMRAFGNFAGEVDDKYGIR